MPQPPLHPEVRQRVIEDLLAGTYPQDLISSRQKVGHGTVSRIKRDLISEGRYDGLAYKAKTAIPVEASPVADPEPITHQAIRKALRNKSLTETELADILDCGPSRVRDAIASMQDRGAMIDEIHGRFTLMEGIHLEPATVSLSSGTQSSSITRVFGALGDNHLCNRHSRLDVLNVAYDEYERRGITEVFNTGNWIDGEARFNKTELIVAPGMDSQINYMIDNYPQRAGITTHYIAGDDHEGWYQQREGVEIGRYLHLRAEEQGRHDLKYLGYGECDVKLQHGTGSACMRVVHPGGGSAYAISYTDQKRVESYQGGEKPQIELAGHYHKALYGYPREVHTLQTGCTCDQTMFMRKKRLQAHVGFWIITITQNSDGVVTRFGTEWFPFFDRGYYENRFGATKTASFGV